MERLCIYFGEENRASSCSRKGIVLFSLCQVTKCCRPLFTSVKQGYFYYKQKNTSSCSALRFQMHSFFPRRILQSWRLHTDIANSSNGAISSLQFVKLLWKHALCFELRRKRRDKQLCDKCAFWLQLQRGGFERRAVKEKSTKGRKKKRDCNIVPV